ncbi:MAG: hypothetical protein KIT27_04765 [Legionellales bacterium]|nr:hypothetical protein [Legionellales bacterium]
MARYHSLPSGKIAISSSGNFHRDEWHFKRLTAFGHVLGISEFRTGAKRLDISKFLFSTV